MTIRLENELIRIRMADAEFCQLVEQKFINQKFDVLPLFDFTLNIGLGPESECSFGPHEMNLKLAPESIEKLKSAEFKKSGLCIGTRVQLQIDIWEPKKREIHSEKK
jgi:hypothetical protein